MLRRRAGSLFFANAWLFAALWASGAATKSAVADTAVPVQGPVLRGVFDPASKTFVAGDNHVGVLALLLVERDSGAFLWAESEGTRWRGYHRLVHERRRRQLVELTKEAARARDHVTARRLLQWAQAEGLKGKPARLLLLRVEKLERRPRKINRKRITPVLEAERKLRVQLPKLLVARTRHAFKEDHELGLRFLRLTLDEFPDDPGALSMLRKLHPKDAPIKDAHRWLAWHVDLERKGFRFTKPSENALKREQHRWRPDLYGVETDRIRLITPLRRMELVADCARRAQLTEAALAELFKTDKPMLRTKDPLTVHVFMHKPNFRSRISYKKATERAPWYQWRYGESDYREDVVRIYAPDGVALGYRPLAHTIVHETTKLWLESRCPRFTSTDWAQAGMVSGLGVSSGLRGFLAEAPVDFENDKLDLAARGTPSLRYVARHAGQLINWKDFFLMDFNDAAKTVNDDTKAEKRDPNRQRRSTVFRHQSAATCHYLYNAGGGRHREALAQFIAEYYKGNQARLDPKVAFGMKAEEIGVDVVAYARRK